MFAHHIFFKYRSVGVISDIYLGSLNKVPDSSHFDLISSMIDLSDIDKEYAKAHLSLFLEHGITTHFKTNNRMVSPEHSYTEIEAALLTNSIDKHRLEKKQVDIVNAACAQFAMDYKVDVETVTALAHAWVFRRDPRVNFEIMNTASFKNTTEILAGKKMLDSVQIIAEPESSLPMYRNLPPIKFGRQYIVVISDHFKDVIYEYINNYAVDDLSEYDPVFKMHADQYEISLETVKNMYINSNYVFTKTGKYIIFAVNEIKQLRTHGLISYCHYNDIDEDINENVKHDFLIKASQKFIRTLQDALLEFKGSSYEQQ